MSTTPHCPPPRGDIAAARAAITRMNVTAVASADGPHAPAISRVQKGQFVVSGATVQTASTCFHDVVVSDTHCVITWTL